MTEQGWRSVVCLTPMESRGAVETDVASYKLEVMGKVLESPSRDLPPTLSASGRDLKLPYRERKRLTME